MYLATFKFYSFILFSTSALENPGLSLATRIFIKDAPSSTDTHTHTSSHTTWCQCFLSLWIRMQFWRLL